MASPEKEDFAPMTAITVPNAHRMVRRMIDLEKSHGGKGEFEAMRDVCVTHGLPIWSLDHIRKHRAKSVRPGLFARIEAAYLRHLERQLAALQHELLVEKAKGDARDQDLLGEVETLLAKVAARRKGGA